MRYEREIIGKNFEKNKKQVRETIKKCGKKILREIVGEKKQTWEKI